MTLTELDISREGDSNAAKPFPFASHYVMVPRKARFIFILTFNITWSCQEVNAAVCRGLSVVVQQILQAFNCSANLSGVHGDAKDVCCYHFPMENLHFMHRILSSRGTLCLISLKMASSRALLVPSLSTDLVDLYRIQMLDLRLAWM